MHRRSPPAGHRSRSGASDYLVKLPDRLELAARVRLHSEAHARLVERNAAFAALEEANATLARERERADRLLYAILVACHGADLRDLSTTECSSKPSRPACSRLWRGTAAKPGVCGPITPAPCPSYVRSLIDADHLWLTPRLANLCRAEGYAGTGEFVKVKLQEGSPLGGVLTQPRIMKMNSDGADSHPVRRGTWVLERILFDPPPPPPKVTPLEEQGIIKAASLRERIAEHARSSGSCIACHRRIDPFGLAFENFDAAGGWRDDVPAGDGQEPAGLAHPVRNCSTTARS